MPKKNLLNSKIDFHKWHLSQNLFIKKISTLIALYFSLTILSAAFAQNATVVIWNFDSQEIGPKGATSSIALAKEMEESLVDILQKNAALNILDREKLKEILEEQKIGSSDLSDIDTKIRLGRIVGAKNMIFGSLTKIGDALRVDLRMISVETTRILTSREINGNTESILSEIDLFAQSVVSRVNTPENSEIRNPRLNDDQMAIRHFENGTKLVGEKKYLQAIESFKKTLSINPLFKAAENQIQLTLEKLSQE